MCLHFFVVVSKLCNAGYFLDFTPHVSNSAQHCGRVRIINGADQKDLQLLPCCTVLGIPCAAAYVFTCKLAHGKSTSVNESWEPCSQL
jgi:hypothetical protein